MRTTEGLPYLSQANFVGQGFDIYGAYNIKTSRITLLFDPEKAGTHEFTFLGKTYALPAYIDGAENTEATYLEETLNTRDEFQNTIAAHAKVNASYGAFSGQMEAAYSRQFTRNNEYMYSFRNYYTRLATLFIKIETQYLTDYFAQRIGELPDHVTQENLIDFEEFFEDFGAYFTSEVNLGGSLDYYVAIDKLSSLTTHEASAMLKAEYRALFASGGVSGDIKVSANWQKYSASREVKIMASGGDPALLTQLINLDPSNPGLDSVQSFSEWASSVQLHPAIADFQLKGIWELCGTKRQVVEEAFGLYGSKMRPRMNVEASYETIPLIILGNQIKPPSDPNSTVGYQMVIIDRSNLTPGGVVFNRYYTVPSTGYRYTHFEAMYNQMGADILQGGYDNPNYVLALASFGMPWNAPPTSSFYGLLRSAGGGTKLQGWMDMTDPGSFSGGQAVYILVGIFGLGPNTGVEALGDDWRGTPVAELQVFFYGQRGTDLYTIGSGS